MISFTFIPQAGKVSKEKERLIYSLIGHNLEHQNWTKYLNSTPIT